MDPLSVEREGLHGHHVTNLSKLYPPPPSKPAQWVKLSTGLQWVNRKPYPVYPGMYRKVALVTIGCHGNGAHHLELRMWWWGGHPSQIHLEWIQAERAWVQLIISWSSSLHHTCSEQECLIRCHRIMPWGGGGGVVSDFTRILQVFEGGLVFSFGQVRLDVINLYFQVLGKVFTCHLPGRFTHMRADWAGGLIIWRPSVHPWTAISQKCMGQLVWNFRPRTGMVWGLCTSNRFLISFKMAAGPFAAQCTWMLSGSQWALCQYRLANFCSLSWARFLS